MTAEVRAVARNPLIRRLKALSLDPADFVVFGSGPLLAYGIRRKIRDLDVVARGAAWARAVESGTPARGAITGDPCVQFWNGRIQFFRSWLTPHWDVDRLIDEAAVVDGVRFAAPAEVLAYNVCWHAPRTWPISTRWRAEHHVSE
ncbi:hypothetical protein [Amycolatopsis sp. YIM 10]|uniref:hypothetical protein n=1 Tax=Amycolatopsis sp. YIM 10 TaxID=2653857 RepID=UPI001290845F|nr:hypothetical protein [Amycolatopsis sp. YIM 10]QFU94354.1 hypothetical protein YIM_46140 [Amycolatopsis sp. YIM 10]